MVGEPDEKTRLGGLQIDRRLAAAPVRRRRRRLLSAAALLLVLLLVLVGLFSRPRQVEMAEVRQARPGEAATVLSASGYVASKRRSIVAPQVAGRLIEVLVDEGDSVREGQIIARLDPADRDVALSRTISDEKTAAARVKTAEAALVKARRDLARTSQLARTGAVARATLQDAQTALQSAESQLNAARSAWAASQEAAAAAALDREHTEVRAPFDGTVVRKIADEGAVLAPAAITAADVGGIVEMVDLHSLEVDAEVSEEQLASIHPGMPALIFLDAWPDEVWRGTTGTVRPAIDKAKATAVVKVAFDTQPRGALPDMGARIAFLSQPLPEQALHVEARLRVPVASVVRGDGGDRVFTVQDGKTVAVPVKVREQIGDEWALDQGPQPGTPIVANPGPDMREGTRVKIRGPT